MNVAVHPQPSDLSVVPANPSQETRRLFLLISELFTKSPHLAHSKALTRFTIFFAINALRALLPNYLATSSLFKQIQALFQKMGGGGIPGVDQSRPGTFADGSGGRVLFLPNCGPRVWSVWCGRKGEMGNVFIQLCGYAEI